MIKLRWIPTLLWVCSMAAILAFGSEGGKLFRSSGIPASWREVAHVLGFAGLGALAALSLAGPRLRTAAIAVVVCLAFAVLDEWHQGFIPWRGRSLSDVGFDLVGIALGVLLVSLSRSRRAEARVRVPSEGESS